LRPDLGFFVSLPQILEMMKGGDDSVLSRVVRFFEAKGIVVRGAHEVAPDLLVRDGAAGGFALDGQDRADAELGFAVRAALGPLDAGQAVVTAGGRVLAIEGAEGTDAMLARVASLRDAGDGMQRHGAELGGVLAKGPKPGQELRVDMPAIGPRTVELAAAAGLSGVAVEAEAVLLLDRSEAIATADARAIAIEGLPKAPPAPQHGKAGDTASPSPLRGMEGIANQGEVWTLPPLGPPPQGGEESRWRVVGRLQPDARAEADIHKGLAAVQRLAPFASGKAVVVSRAYILSVTAAEPAPAMLERTRALRQWGVGAKRRIGVLAYRADTGGAGADDAGALLERAAAAGLAGVAVTGPPTVLAAFESAGDLADRHGLFLVTRGERQ
jgi:lipid-A-disaccharide synthase